MRRSTVTLIVLVLVAIATVIAVVITASKPSGPTNSTSSEASAGASQQQPNDNPPASGSDVQQPPVAGVIYIDNNIFAPAQFTIPKGSAVTWTNNDDVDHTIAADKGVGPMSGVIGPGASYTYTFDGVGSFQYHCDIHKSMRGTIIVQ